jgi:putative holliday junction resolvase
MRTLSLDIGQRRTGVAFLDDATGIPLPLTTLTHRSARELTSLVSAIVEERKVDRLIIGLPLLPDGTEGEQARIVREVAESFEAFGKPMSFVDERYTTPSVRSSKALRHSPPPSAYDGDAAAACALLQRL